MCNNHKAIQALSNEVLEIQRASRAVVRLLEERLTRIDNKLFTTDENLAFYMEQAGLILDRK